MLPALSGDEMLSPTAFSDMNPVATCVIAPTGKIVYWNDAAARRFGQAPDQVIGRDLEDLMVAPDQRVAAADGFVFCLFHGTPAEATGNVVAEPAKPALELTVRQRQVLKLMAEGRSTREIASKLALSVKTIETHRGHLMQRLKLKSVAGLVRYAVSVGLVPTSPWPGRVP
jgi:DNA-binding CsgD family transcriptional regulator